MPIDRKDLAWPVLVSSSRIEDGAKRNRCRQEFDIDCDRQVLVVYSANVPDEVALVSEKAVLFLLC